MSSSLLRGNGLWNVNYTRLIITHMTKMMASSVSFFCQGLLLVHVSTLCYIWMFRFQGGGLYTELYIQRVKALFQKHSFRYIPLTKFCKSYSVSDGVSFHLIHRKRIFLLALILQCESIDSLLHDVGHWSLMG